MVKDLLQDAAEAEWKDDTNSRILLQQNSSDNFGVQRNVLEGVFHLVNLPRLATPLMALPDQRRANLLHQYRSGTRVRQTVLDVKFDPQIRRYAECTNSRCRKN